MQQHLLEQLPGLSVDVHRIRWFINEIGNQHRLAHGVPVKTAVGVPPVLVVTFFVHHQARSAEVIDLNIAIFVGQLVIFVLAEIWAWFSGERLVITRYVVSRP